MGFKQTDRVGRSRVEAWRLDGQDDEQVFGRDSRHQMQVPSARRVHGRLVVERGLALPYVDHDVVDAASLEDQQRNAAVGQTGEPDVVRLRQADPLRRSRLCGIIQTDQDEW